MQYNTYIDESGNTGNNLVDQNQKFFTIAAVSIPQNEEEAILSFIQKKFDLIKEIGETEIKSTRWVRTPKRSAILKSILELMKEKQCDFSLVILEKRYMVCGLIVDNFLDGAYNDFKDYTWCNDNEEKKKAAQYFYNILDDNEIELISNAFTHPQLDEYVRAYDIVFAKTQDFEYKRMLAGCHVEELFSDDYAVVMENAEACPSVVRSANYTSFSALGMIIAQICRRKGYRTNIVFDDCKLCNEAFKNQYERFIVIEDNEILEKLAGIISWKDWLDSFKVVNSKSSFLMQTADILATSVMKTLEKVFADGDFTEYDIYIKTLIKGMLEEDTFLFVMSERNIQKLASIMILNASRQFEIGHEGSVSGVRGTGTLIQ